MPNGFDDLAASAGELLKAAPKIYDDGLKPTVQESGKFLGRIPRLVNAVLAPLDKWILHKEYNIEETKVLLAKKLEHVDDNKIISPEPYVAIPALQAISYSMVSEELRNLYANLLAKSMNEDTKGNVHPAYVEIIKQLSPLDAQTIDSFKLFERQGKNIPITKIRYCKDSNTKNLGLVTGNEGYDVFEHIIDPNIIDAPPNSVAVSIQNLIRLGLIDVDYNRRIVAESSYDYMKNNPVLKAVEDQCKDSYSMLPQYQDYKVTFIKGLIKVTTLGYNFSRICSMDSFD